MTCATACGRCALFAASFALHGGAIFSVCVAKVLLAARKAQVSTPIQRIDAQGRPAISNSNSAVFTIDAAAYDRLAASASYSIILDSSATVGSLPFGVNVFTITGIPCDNCLVRSSSERPVS